MANELVATKGKVRIEGKVVGFDPSGENSYREGTTNSGGKPYRSVSLTVKTAPNNVIYNADLFGTVPEKKVKVFSNKNNEKKQLEIDFKDRNNLPEGFTPFGFGTVGLGFEKNDKGSVKMHNKFNYDGVEVIKDNVSEASVWIDAEFNINTYVSNGEKKTNVKYQINRIGLQKEEVDFDKDDFKEVASFEQEFVVTNTEVDREAKKLYVGARIIHWDKKWSDTTFVVDTEKYSTLAQNIYKKCKFGDLLTVEGIIRNGTVVVEVEEEPVLNWGGETPAGQGKKVNRNKISELQITNVKKHVAKAYKEDDFVIEENPFKQESGNPFGDSSDDDNDLPW